MLHIKSHLSYLLKFAEQFNLEFLLGEIKVLIDLIKYTYFSELSYYSMKKVKVRLGLPGSSVHGDSHGKNTGVGSCFLLQGIFPTEESNLSLFHYRRILYCLSHQGSPRVLEWVDYLFSSRSFWPRNGTRISHIADRFFTSWATSELFYSWSILPMRSCLQSLNWKN